VPLETGTLEDEDGVLTAFNSESSEPDLTGGCAPSVADSREGSCFVAAAVAENTSLPKNKLEANPFPETTGTLESLAVGWEETVLRGRG
jgi:hypothetical protein